MRRPRPRRVLLATAAVVSLLGTSGCATLVIGRPSPLEPAPRPPGGELVIVGSDGGAVDEQARSALADLETFWTEQFPEVYGQEFQPLQGGYFSVDPDASDPREYPQGVGCGLELGEAASNAFYCQDPRSANSDAITYDRAFLAELADGYGRFLPALVMAHEFGHAVQGRVGMPGSSIATETQADCMAGAWSAWVASGESEHSQLREPELDELLSGYFLLRDPVGTSTAEESAHGSYFDRVSGFQDGFDGGPETCRDEFGPERLFTQGTFRDNDDALAGGNTTYSNLIDIVESSLPFVWDEAFRTVFDGDFQAPELEPFDGEAPACATDQDLDLVLCPDEGVVAYDEQDLTRPAFELGDFAVATAIAIPYSLAAREQLGLSTDDEEAVRSALCLTGWYAAKVYNAEAGDKVLISPGDIDESVQFLLAYGKDPNVLPDVDLTGFQQVDVFRAGFVRGLRACEVGA
jgi:predicted metalloprotease